MTENVRSIANTSKPYGLSTHECRRYRPTADDGILPPLRSFDAVLQSICRPPTTLLHPLVKEYAALSVQDSLRITFAKCLGVLLRAGSIERSKR
jgi:hypothetical protein